MLLERLHSENERPDGARSPRATGTTRSRRQLGDAIAEAIDDFGPDFDEEGNPLEEGESDRIKSEEEREKRGPDADSRTTIGDDDESDDDEESEDREEAAASA